MLAFLLWLGLALTGARLGHGSELAGDTSSLAAAAAEQPEPPPAGEQAPVKVPYEYQGPWEYRWGDSPTTAQGTLQWAQPVADGAGWTRISHFHALSGRAGQNFLWMRTRLDGPQLADPVLYLFVIDQIVEAYLDGQLIYRFGEFSGPQRLRFAGYKTHFIRVSPQYQGKLLTLRIYSAHNNIGVSGIPRLGERADIVIELFAEDLSRLLIGTVLSLLGLLVLFFFVLKRQERAYLMYGAFALSAGLYFLMQLQVRALLIDRPLLWIHVELGAMYSVAFFLCGYIDEVFGRGPLSLTRRLWQLHGVCLLASLAAVLSGRVLLLQTLPVFQVLLLIDALVLPFTVLRAAWLGSTEARIFLAGFSIAAAILVYDVLAAVGIVPRTQLTMSHIGNSAFIMSMGTILSRRFFLLQQRLRDYAAVLQLSLASTQALAPEQRAQVALDELLRMLGAERALLFLFQEDNKALVFSLGRDRHGNRIDNPQGISYMLIKHALGRRRPLILQPGQRLSAATSGADEPGAASSVTPGPSGVAQGVSVMAAPLLAREQLLGVVYLESDASRRGFRNDDRAILMGLASHLAIAIVSSRAVRLEVEATMAKQRYEEQRNLLDAAVRLAAGDLSTPIQVVPGSATAHLAQALESMRRDIFAKVEMLQARTTEVQSLNEELRRQIEQRSRRLMSAILRQQGGRPVPLKPLEVGQVLVGRYRVIRLLGQGAMGVVYEVERSSDRRRLAAKLLLTRADPTAVVRFAREAQILARLNHPNLIAIRDVDMTTDGVLFIVLELVVGSALSGLRTRYRELPWALGILQQIADALAAIHEASVVHRDLKPANVLVASDGDSQRPLVKLADFGVSLLLAENTDPLVSAAAHPRVAVAVNPAASSSESGEAIDPWLQSDAFGQQALAQPAPALSDSHLALLPDSDADVPGATVSLGPGSLPRAAAPTPPVIPTAAVDAATLHPEAEPVSAAPQPAHDQAAADAAPGRLTQAGMLVGTPMFMAPELWNSGSQQAGPAADIFSFGVIACELLTGQLPFTNAPVLARWQGERVTIARLHQLRADLPTELANLVDSCLREEPAARPKARVLADRLGAFVSG